MEAMDRPETLLSGLAFPEGPRWREGRLVFSDMQADEVLAVDLEGKTERICGVSEQPSGLGWLPDGRMLVVSMRDRRLLRLEADGTLAEVADLSPWATFHCNDMVVDAAGNAYVGNFGFDLHRNESQREACLLRVTPEGEVSVAAEGLLFPNGAVITPDGATLVVGETFGGKLTAFEIAEDGGLSNRRVWAQLEGAVPDGICLDEAGGIWVASPVGQQVLRVTEGGDVTHKVPVESEAFACMLGGPDGRTLFVCTAKDSHPDVCRGERTGRIEIVTAPYPRAGLP
jgi:sugar lactone lactonase YvrE